MGCALIDCERNGTAKGKMSITSDYIGIDGGVNYSPGGGGASFEMGAGIGGGVSPGELSSRSGSWGGGW